MGAPKDGFVIKGDISRRYRRTLPNGDALWVEGLEDATLYSSSLAAHEEIQGKSAMTVQWVTGVCCGKEPQDTPKTILPTDKTLRKESPMARGCLDYFPRALFAIANCSFVGNQQHNPGEELHWAKGKSTDHADALMRHFVERGKVDEDNVRHSAKAAWRALALLEEELTQSEDSE